MKSIFLKKVISFFGALLFVTLLLFIINGTYLFFFPKKEQLHRSVLKAFCVLSSPLSYFIFCISCKVIFLKMMKEKRYISDVLKENRNNYFLFPVVMFVMFFVSLINNTAVPMISFLLIYLIYLFVRNRKKQQLTKVFVNDFLLPVIGFSFYSPLSLVLGALSSRISYDLLMHIDSYAKRSSDYFYFME